MQTRSPTSAAKVQVPPRDSWNRAVMKLFVNAHSEVKRTEEGKRGGQRQVVPVCASQKRNNRILNEYDVRACEWTGAKARSHEIPKQKEERNRSQDSETLGGARLPKNYHDVAGGDHERKHNDRSYT